MSGGNAIEDNDYNTLQKGNVPLEYLLVGNLSLFNSALKRALKL